MRRMSQSRGLVAAMESEEAAAAAAEATAVAATPAADAAFAEPIEQNADSLETDLMDVVEAEAEGAPSAADTDTALVVADTLTDVTAALESCAANGGLNKDAAHVVKLALEGLYTLAGIDTAASGMPALESFGGTGTRVSATKLALEDIKEQAAKIWEAIKLAIKKSIAWLNEHFIKIFGAAGKIKGRAEKIKAQAGKASGDAKSKTVEDERLVQSLHVGGKIDAVAGAATVEKLTKTVLKEDPTVAKGLLEVLKAGKVAGIKDMLMKVEVAAGNELGKVSNPKQEGLEDKEGFEVYRSEALPGGKALLGYVPDGDKITDDKDFATKFADAKIFMGDGYPNVKAPTDKTLPTLAPADIAKIADLAAAIGTEVEKYKLGVNKVTEVKTAILSEIDKLSKATGEESEARILARIGASFSKLTDVPVTGFAVYAVNTAKRLLDYCELSLKQYGATAAAPAAEKKPDAAAAPAAAAT